MTNYKKPEAWEKTTLLVKEVNLLARSFPKEEIYGLTSQLKRAVISIPCNIAEGYGRQYKKDTLHFLHLSRGSIYEAETLLNIAMMFEKLPEEKFESISNLTDECRKILNGLLTYLERSELK